MKNGQMTIYEYIAAESALSYLPPEAAEIWEGCFDLKLHELPPGARFDTTGRVAYLLRGAGEVGAWEIERGAFFGVNARGTPERQVFTSHTGCLLLLWDSLIMTHVCYRACWFHARFVDEVRRAAAKRSYRSNEA